ncbi:alpha/beta hydrolase [Thalassoglobus polymorphus]|nr:alpha/beta hydrolase [Thalassoglobus polymorphus]
MSFRVDDFQDRFAAHFECAAKLFNGSVYSTMKSIMCIVAICFATTFCQSAFAQRERPLTPIAAKLEPSRFETYKTVEDRELRLHIFEPEELKKSDQRPVFLVIHGGGWTGGNPRSFYPMADHFAQRGMLAISLEYRFMNRKQGTTVFDCVEDARDAVRYLRKNAERLKIDPNRIVVAGASAGGHLALSTSMFDTLMPDRFNKNEPEEKTSSRANALVLLYPVIDTSEEGYGQKKIGERWRELSPVHSIKELKSDMPPTILFHGTGDTVTPYAGAAEFHRLMEEKGNQCELISHQNGVHGYLIFDIDLYNAGIIRIENFLTEQMMIEPIVLKRP